MPGLLNKKMVDLAANICDLLGEIGAEGVREFGYKAIGYSPTEDTNTTNNHRADSSTDRIVSQKLAETTTNKQDTKDNQTSKGKTL